RRRRGLRRRGPRGNGRRGLSRGRTTGGTLAKHERNSSFSLSLQQLPKQRRQQTRTLFLRLRTAGHMLGQLPEYFRGAVICGNLRNHLPVIRGGAEQLRLERNDRHRFAV